MRIQSPRYDEEESLAYSSSLSELEEKCNSVKSYFQNLRAEIANQEKVILDELEMKIQLAMRKSADSVAQQAVVLPSSSNSKSDSVLPDSFSFKWGSIGSNPGQLYHPWGICADDGEIYVVSHGNHSIQVFSESGEFQRRWGSHGKSDSFLQNPWCISVYNNEVFVTEQGNNRVSVFDKFGNFLRNWGRFGKEPGMFDCPWGIFVYNDRVYISQHQSHIIQVFDLEGNLQDEFGKGILQYPAGLIVDNDLIYVCDYCNHRIAVFNLSGKLLRFIGYGNGDADGELDYPTTLAVVNGTILVGEFENNRISAFNPEGEFIKSWGSYGIEDGKFDGMYGMTFYNGRVYACDYSSHRIQVFESK
jgi:DNA-binding beta-propeller fold protein YncE